MGGEPGEIRKFWEALPPAEVTAWARGSNLVPVRVESADGKWQEALALPDIEVRLAAILPPAPQLGVINPFDPAIRDRARLKRIFGFDYTNEMFVPAAKRSWGYYVYPLQEGDSFVGRIEAKGDRQGGTLGVTGFWAEEGVQRGKGRADRLRLEVERLVRFGGLTPTPVIPSTAS